VRRIAATYIFASNQPPIKNGILVCDDDGTIIEIINRNGVLREEQGMEFYSGILVPGFVNTHCHLELAHLKGKIEEGIGIGGFIGKINKIRNEDTENIKKAIQFADRKMWSNGTAVIGDISNSLLSLNAKSRSKIFYHTFVESYGFHPSRAKKSFDYAQFVSSEFQKSKLSTSIVPHSPYSVSEPLFKAIKENAIKTNGILSIHNQESEAEAEFYKSGTGPIHQHLHDNLGIDTSHWKPTGQSSLSSILKYLPGENQLILVHNTYTKKEDIDDLKKHRSKNNTFFTLCPNSNLFIENQLPPVYLFQNEDLNICLGTDSLASNHELSILSEMITLQLNFPLIELEELIIWSTLNGAKALNVENSYGSFESGKKPGVNLITGINFKTMKLTNHSGIKRLL
jgi:cytosine/adenosine deaminase-related metal-dependent hydrolase